MAKRGSSWSLAEAKAHLSSVVDQALEAGPQVITRRGKVAAVVVSAAEWQRTKRKTSLVEFFARSPLRAVAKELDVTRLEDPPREFEW